MRDRVMLWAQALTSVACAIACLLTVVRADWIEAVFGVDPDGGNGTLEWLIAAALFVAATSIALLARRQWRRLGATS